MTNDPRVALFADTFYETNGAANVLRRLTAFAKETSREFLCIRAGKETHLDKSGPVWTLDLKRSPVSIPVDGSLKYDPFLWRYKGLVKRTLSEFQPSLIHVTGLNDISQLGFYFAHYDKINAVASWHTNTHEYCGKRLADALSWLPSRVTRPLARTAERLSFRGLMSLHFLAQMQLAPNEELVRLLSKETKRPAALMSRGVDTDHFNPAKRCRDDESELVLGYVGRLRPEKNVRFLAEIDSQLLSSGFNKHKWLIVGEGCESDWLQRNLSNADLTGVLHGEDLAAAYANMDVFVFPSKTDAFGNVVLEGMASGVPAVVMADHGPKFLINDELDGFVARDDKEFVSKVRQIVREGAVCSQVRTAARIGAESRSWARVFKQLYRDYRTAASLSKNVRSDSVEPTTETAGEVQEQTS